MRSPELDVISWKKLAEKERCQCCNEKLTSMEYEFGETWWSHGFKFDLCEDCFQSDDNIKTLLEEALQESEGVWDL